MTEITHERCSELLGDYEAGRLDAPTAEAVAAHLAACEACAAERAVVALLATDVTPLTSAERGRLHDGVLAAIDRPEPEATTARVIVPVRTPWWARVAPALGAAAVLVLIAVAVATIGPNLGGGGDDSAGALGGGGEGGSVAQEGQGGNLTPEAGTESTDKRKGHTDRIAVSAGKASTAADEPTFFRLGEIADKELRRERDAPLFNAYSQHFTVIEVPQRRDVLLDELVARSPRALRDQIRRCALVVFENGPQASLPAFSATGTRKGREVLVLGFAWSERESGPVYRYMWWTWPLGGECGHPIGYEAGRIRSG